VFGTEAWADGVAVGVGVAVAGATKVTARVMATSTPPGLDGETVPTPLI
jgi:hypothetical protein